MFKIGGEMLPYKEQMDSFVEAIGKFCGFTINSELINNIILGFAGILVVLGIVSAPTDESDNQNLKEENNKTKNKEINNKKDNENKKH